MAERNAASVLPDPVGAWTRVWTPAAMTGQPFSWAGVGPSNVRSNHALVLRLKTSSAAIRTSVQSLHGHGEPRTSRRLGARDGGGDAAERGAVPAARARD